MNYVLILALCAWLSLFQLLQGQIVTVSNLAGQCGTSGNSVGTSALFNNPNGVAFDPVGNIYVADTGNHCIKKIDLQKVVTKFAGVCGQSGYVDGSGSNVRFTSPYGLAFNASNSILIVTEANTNVLRFVNAAGAVSSVSPSNILIGAASQTSVPVLGSSGNLFVSSSDNHCIRNIIPQDINAGVSYQPGLVWRRYSHTWTTHPSDPTSMTSLLDSSTFSSMGTTANLNLFTFNADNYACDFIGYFYAPTSGTYSFGLNSDDGSDLFVDGNLVASFYGGHPFSNSPVGGTQSSVNLQQGYHRLYVRFEELLGGDGLSLLYNATGTWNIISSDNLFYLPEDYTNITQSLLVNGYCGVSGNADGAGTTIRLSSPSGLLYQSQTNTLLVADSANHCIRAVINGISTMFAGACGTSGNNNAVSTIPKSSALFNSSKGLTYDSASGDIFVADTGNHCIRKISSDGTVRVVAGQCGTSGTTAGYSTNARFNIPRDLVFNPISGRVYVADTGNHCIREISFGACPVGTEPNIDRLGCVKCPVGKYRPDLTYQMCLLCPMGQESSSDGLSCVPCTAGSYRTLNQTVCTPCPVNSVCNSTYITGCTQGFYFNLNSCVSCPLGKESLDGLSCVSCGSGKFRPSSKYSSCITCPLKSQCNSTAITRCDNRYRLNSAGDGCEQCPIGQHSTDGLNCVSCPNGYFKPSQQYEICIQCPLYSHSCTESSLSCQTGYYYDSGIQCRRNETYFSTPLITPTQFFTSTVVSTQNIFNTATLTRTNTQNNFVTPTPVTSTSVSISTVTLITSANNNLVSTVTVNNNQFSTVTISGSGQTVNGNSGEMQSQSNSVDVLGIVTLPFSPLIFALTTFGAGLFLMLIMSLVCFRGRRNSKRKDEDFDPMGMTTTMNTASQRTFTNSSTVR